MLHPLVSLWRHSCRVTFYEAGGPASGPAFPGAPEGGGPGAPLTVRRRFRSTEEAGQYLRYWAADPGARAELRWLAGRAGASLAHGQGQQAWLDPLAAKLQAGLLVVLEESARRAQPGRLVAPSTAAATPAALAALPALSAMPQSPAPVNLLPALEDIRVEGAEVLPELDQAMEQVQASLASVEAAGVSLEPAPSRVADIQSAMTEAASASGQALDGA